ncbi:Carboxypeptidase A4, partial [Lobosporangium transversale]
MRYLWTTSSVALFCAVLTVLAYPHPPWDLQAPSTWPEDNTHQQVFLPPHHRSKNNNGNTNEYARFDDEQVIRMEISSLPQLKRLEVLVKDHNLDLWSNLRIGTVDVRVPVSKKRVFATETNDIPSTVMIDNLQSLVSQQASASDGLYRSQNDDWDFTNSTFWLKYHDFATLNNFTETMVQKFPDLVKRVSIGYTYEGKEIF